MNFKYIYILILTTLILGCQEVVDVEVEEGTTRLVVEGRIEKVKGQNSSYQSITLSTTAAYFEDEETPRVRGAVVRVSDERGNVFQFKESGSVAGLYENINFAAVIDRIYTLRIEHDGEVYEGSEQLNAVTAIDSIYQEFKEKTFFEDEGIKVKIDFTDPGAEENYYRWEQFRDGDSYLYPNPGTKWTIVSSDEFFNGRKIIGREPNDEMIYEAGQLASVRQHAISKNEFEYLFLLYDQATGGGPYDTPPSTIRGNMENLTNPDNYPLGYFSAGEVDEAELVIK